MVEFVIIVPALFLVLFGTVEVSRLWLTVGVVAEAAREGARAGAVSFPFDNLTAEAKAIGVLAAANLSTASSHTVACSPACASGSGATVTATVAVPFNTPIPLLVPLFGGSNGLTVSQTAQMRYEP
jgi:Flp pilus assembly protein TadG